MGTTDTEHPEPALPPAIEDLAGEILLGPATEVAARYEQLCADHESLRPALQRLRHSFERAAQLLGDSEAAAAPSPVLPSSIGPYQCLRLLGEGAFGIVFLATQQEPIRRQVAIKLLHARASSAATLGRFQVERTTLARMNHAAIARIFDAGVDRHGQPYFVMEYVPGEPLNRFVATRNADLHERLALFLAACEGVNHAHQRGIIHRDLKPQNILVTEVDGHWQPKVIDFGLAKIVTDDDPDPGHTRAGAVLGTPAYMSPEQVRGDAQGADTRTDVYALGVILYELLTGEAPFAAAKSTTASLAELQRLICDVEPPLASVRAEQKGLPFARQLRGDLDWILRMAMAKDRDHRYATVAEFAADLHSHLQHQPVRAGPPSTSYLLRKFVRRHRVTVVTSLLVVASLLLGLLVSADMYRQAQANLADFWRLADVVELDALRHEAQDLWPSMPGKLPAHEHWLERAHGLLARREQHGATLQALTARLGNSGPAMSAEERHAARFLTDRLQQHLAALTAFAAEVDAVAKRAEFARTVQARTVDEKRTDWERAIAAVAGSARYDHLLLQPIAGLAPLGPDPASGLEEFAVLQSGRVPVRDASGQLQIGDDTAIVLVLIPGGHVKVGNQDQDPSAPRYDPWREQSETDVADEELAPFLIGKFELTQGQVANLGVEPHALGRSGSPMLGGPDYTSRHPEEAVLGPEVAGWLPHFELRLPTMHEWEAAARAGSDSVFGYGDHISDLQGRANVADATLAEINVGVHDCDRSLRDGWPSHAPVGSFAPNAFGLYDVIGNVAELTMARDPNGALIYLARGGSYLLGPLAARIGEIRLVMANQTTAELGVRVARDVPFD